jgi:hypothetical protein
MSLGMRPSQAVLHITNLGCRMNAVSGSFAAHSRRSFRWQALAAAIIAALFWVLQAGDGRHEGGPLETVNEHGYSLTVAPGESFTDAMETLTVRGDRPAVIESVELVGGEGLEVLGFSLVRPEREVNVAWRPGYPPVDDTGLLDPTLIIPGEGAVIRPHVTQGWELLLGLEVTSPGPLWREGLRINYSVDGKRYSRVLPAQLSVCTSEDHLDESGLCPAENLTEPP